MNITIISAAIAAALGFGAAWRWQAANITQMEFENATRQLALEREYATLLADHQAQVVQAQAAATVRVAAIAKQRDAASRSVVGLRDTIATAMQAAGTSLDACLAHASTAGAVLGDCSERLVNVATAADGCFSDRQTLTAAWPK